MTDTHPLHLARKLYGQYMESTGKPLPPPPPPGKLVLEEHKPRGRASATPRARSGEPWTDQERMVLVRSWLKDASLEQISVDLQRTRGSIAGQLKRIGFELD